MRVIDSSILGETAGRYVGHLIAQVILHLHQIVAGAPSFLYLSGFRYEACASGNTQVGDLGRG